MHSMNKHLIIGEMHCLHKMHLNKIIFLLLSASILQKNLTLSLVLWVFCYAVLLIPPYLPAGRTVALHIVIPSTGLKLWQLALPLGHEGAEETLRKTFSALRNYDLPAGLQTLRCRECVVVGNGGILQGSRLGAYIDQYDIIIRMNNAPVTTIRLLYGTGVPEHGCGGSGAFQEPGPGGSLALVLALQLCDEVTSLRMDAMATQVVHDVGAETLFLRDLVRKSVVNDVTGLL
uniref:Uncharacterized protein n=1 Tax=Denticeps clupeoides TaxID=299321 RepID=A0AAY3ZXP5_9TELE